MSSYTKQEADAIVAKIEDYIGKSDRRVSFSMRDSSGIALGLVERNNRGNLRVNFMANKMSIEQFAKKIVKEGWSEFKSKQLEYTI